MATDAPTPSPQGEPSGTPEPTGAEQPSEGGRDPFVNDFGYRFGIYVCPDCWCQNDWDEAAKVCISCDGKNEPIRGDLHLPLAPTAPRGDEALDDAVEWIGVVRDELVTAGFPAGDRVVALESIRTMLRTRLSAPSGDEVGAACALYVKHAREHGRCPCRGCSDIRDRFNAGPDHEHREMMRRADELLSTPSQETDDGK